jgi:hypothetical protein
VSSVQANWTEIEDSTAPSFFTGAVVPYLLLAIVSALYLVPFVRTLTWNPDGGIYIYGAQRVLDGAIPARDFVELQGPGSFYWLAMFYKLFGVSILTARAVLLLTGVATALLVFQLSRQIGGMGLFAALFVLVTSIPFSVMNSPHYDSNLFGLLSFAVFIFAARELARGVPKWHRIAGILFLAGALAGLTTCILQQKGAYLAASYALSLGLLHRKYALRWTAIVIAGYASVVLTESALYAVAGALPSFIYNNLIWPMSRYSTVNTSGYGFILWEIWFPNWFSTLRVSFPSLLAMLGTVTLSIPFLLILALPLIAVLGYIWRHHAFRRELLPYWLAGYALWLSELHHLDIGHLRNGCLILLILLFVLCETHAKQFPKQVVIAITACVMLTATVDLLGALSLKTPIQTRRGTLLARKNDTALEFLLRHTQPGDDVFVYPYQPIYYFVADVRNPTRFSNLMYQINTDEHFREAICDLDRKKVRYVLWDAIFSGENLKSVFPSYRPPPAGKLIMEPYLERQYRQIGFENGFRILERKDKQ